MRIHWRDEVLEQKPTNPRIDPAVKKAIKSEIESAFSVYLESPFIVNDTKWFEYKNGKLNPRVTNSAEHISKRFQKGLHSFGWKTDHSIENQEIDGYKEFVFQKVNSDNLSDEAFREILQEIPLDENFVPVVRTLFYCNVRTPRFLRPPIFDAAKFVHSSSPQTFRVGLEFETGNIASSFRAFSKLNFLFTEGKIDIGVFITSVSKAVSTRIWPSANRNGSLEELEQRNYSQEFRFPGMIAGFEPDGWDSSATYLDKDGRYEIHEVDYQYLDLKKNAQKKMRASNHNGLYKEP